MGAAATSKILIFNKQNKMLNDKHNIRRLSSNPYSNLLVSVLSNLSNGFEISINKNFLVWLDNEEITKLSAI